MMKFFIMTLFLIPLLSNWYLFMFVLMLMSLLFVFFNLPTNFMSGVSGLFGLDIISYSFISLTLWILFLMLMASYSIYMGNNNSKEFLFIIIFMLMSLLITFSVDNLLLFYLSFEMSLIPTLFLIFGWGYQPERLVAGYYLLFYTLFASLPMLVSIFYISTVGFSLNFWFINLDLNFYLYLSLIMAFLIKMPMVFVHFWLPKAHVEAPISGSMVLAGILLKLGGYGLLRIYLFLMNYSVLYNYFFISLTLFGVSLVGLLCLCQVDIKSMIAYSSVAHMGLVICGIMTGSYLGFVGSLVLMIGHGFCSSGLFCLANLIYERTHSRSLLINKGLIIFMPGMSLLWFLFVANNAACPPSLNLLGEIFIINSVVSWHFLTCIFLMMSSFLSCCYSIYLYSITHHGLFCSGLRVICEGNFREYMLILFHWLPLNLLILKFDTFSLFL
uniref:NADH-ubiquinone oxidoreductase chain 4 n=1 Tax=Cydnidae sp. ITV1034 TaxID=2508782 RepID=A0A481MW16_9HEMI|nr:NADH dehydrogenase subunit 4 [Cydnidae sp. ITV1034]